jgi:hypothetical protein
VTKLISLIAAGVVGVAIAFVAVTGVISSTTAAPHTNPASAPLVNYGDSK